MAEIDKLSLQISSDASSAVSGIDALSASLSKLKAATSGGLGLNAVAKGLDSVKNAVSNLGNITNNLNGLARAVKELKNLGNIKVSASIGNQIKNIGTALSNLNIGDGANKIREMVAALKPLETIGKSGLSSIVNALNKLPEALNKIDMRTLYTQISSLTRIMRPLAVEMQRIADGFRAFPSRIQRLIQDNGRLQQSNNATGKSYINLWAKLRMAYVGIKTISKYIASSISKINSYIENVNLFTVSMGKFAGEAKEYAEQVGDIMGIDPGEWMRNQGLFMTLATGFGVVSDRAFIMSKNLTQLGYDISSFFNIPYEDAMQKLQSGLAGELEPLRRLGYDISQARLQQEAYTLGITKKLSAMTQAEKAELRYHAIMTQVTTSHGDMARTLEAPANQLRVLKAQLEQAGRAIGSIFIPALNAILPYVIAVVKVIRILAESIASLFGFKMPEVDYSGVGNLASGAEDASGALGDAAENAKKLQKYTMGFDELNVIDTSAGSSGGETSSGGTGFDFKLPEYDFLGGAVESKVNTIVEEMKEWLGLTGEINSWSDLFNTKLGQILKTVGAIGLALGAWKITTTLVTSAAALKTALETLGKDVSKGLTITAGVILAVTGITLMLTGIQGVIVDGLDALDIGDLLLGGASLIAGGAMLGKAFGDAFLGAAIGSITAGVGMMFAGVYDALTNGVDWDNLALSIGGVTLAVWGLHGALGSLGGGVGLAIGGLTMFATGIADFLKNGYSMKNVIMIAAGALGILVGVCWAFNAALLANPITWIIAGIIALGAAFVILWNECDGFRNFLINLWNGIVNVVVGVATWFYDTLIKPVCDFFMWLWNTVKEGAVGLWNGIVSVFVGVGSWFNNTVIQPIANFFTGMWDGLKNGAIAAWEGIKNTFSTVAEFFKNIFQTAWAKVKEVFSVGGKIFDGIKDGIVTAFKTVVNAIIKGINKVVKLPFEGINNVLDTISGLSIAGVEPFAWLTWRAPIPQIPLLAEGGMPDTGQMFIAREAGPELVGSIGRRTAVVNNDQIVEGISHGVSAANTESNMLLREQNSLLRAMLEKETGVYLDGKTITKSVEKHQRERGRVLVTGGAY